MLRSWIPGSRSVWLLWGSLVVAWVSYLVVMLLISIHRDGSDFLAYYRAAHALLDNKNLYTDLYASMPYLYPPLLAMILAPFLLLTPDLQSATTLWAILNALALIGLTFLLSQQAGSNPTRVMIWILPLIFAPTFQSFILGQVTILLTLLTIAAWAAYRSGWRALAGIFLVIASWIKVYPALLLLYFIWKRDWRLVFSAAISALAFAGLQIAVAGWDTFLGYFTDILPILAGEGQSGINHSNHSILGFAQKMFSSSPQVIPLLESPMLVTLTRLSLSCLIIGMFIYLTTRPWRTMQATSTAIFDLEYSLVLTMALLLGSTLGTHGIVSMLLPIIVLIQNLPRSGSQRLSMIMAIVIAVLLINFHLFIILGYLIPPSDNILPGLVLSLGFMGMMLLWAMLANRLRQIRQYASSISEIEN